ncbi:type IV secretion system protein [Lysobacter pythonis]|uniref:Type IV secretion system protein n=1 Tax=Solilutibacter pythonis TaxID=2483112 RepID=A0A3M2HUB3_9GAMM|nr:type IV secretion system protein [Lysobacter pythonis]RMH90999.1 type IV secretion system protein [Lysobacter pythonis]
MGDVGQWVLFRIIFLHLDEQIGVMRNNMMGGFIQWALLLLTTLVTIWIIFQGWLIVTGRSREPMMALVTNALRIGLVSMLAMAFSYKSTELSDLLSTTMPRAVMGVVTGGENDPAEKIDKNFALMGATFAVMNAAAASSGGRDGLLDQVKQATTMSAVGTAGPAVVGGAILLAYKVALGLFVGFGPLFILCLIFPSTKQLFSKWLYYGIGTTFSLAVLAFMVGVATNLVLKVGVVMLGKYVLLMQGTGASDGLNTIAMQQGGLGLILTILLITCPPMAAMFFQGTLGQVATMYSQFGVGAGQARDAAGNPAGGYRPADNRLDYGRGESTGSSTQPVINSARVTTVEGGQNSTGNMKSVGDSKGNAR